MMWPVLNIVDIVPKVRGSYLFIFFFTYSVSTYQGLLSRQGTAGCRGCSDRQVMVPELRGFLSWDNCSPVLCINTGCCGGTGEESLARQGFWGLPGAGGRRMTLAET